MRSTERFFAARVASRLQAVGLVTSIYVLPKETELVDELEGAILRQCLYAVIITAQHELHNSVTVTILHGTPEGIAVHLRTASVPRTGKFHSCFADS